MKQHLLDISTRHIFNGIKMKAFATHRRLFRWMCIFPMAENTELWKKILMTVFGISVPLIEVFGLMASIVYVSKYATADLEGSVKTLFQIAAYINVSYVMAVAFFKRKQILNIFKRFQSIYDAREFSITQIPFLFQCVNWKGKFTTEMY